MILPCSDECLRRPTIQARCPYPEDSIVHFPSAIPVDEGKQGFKPYSKQNPRSEEMQQLHAPYAGCTCSKPYNYLTKWQKKKKKRKKSPNSKNKEGKKKKEREIPQHGILHTSLVQNHSINIPHQLRPHLRSRAVAYASFLRCGQSTVQPLPPLNLDRTKGQLVSLVKVRTWP